MAPKAFPLLFFLAIPLLLRSQTDSVDIQVPPAFPGGEKALYEYLYANFKIPEAAYKAGVDGQVAVSFVIEKDGSIGAVQIVRPLHPAVDAEIIRVVQAMPRWAPGHANGNPVRVRFTFPMNVHASLEKESTAQKRVGIDMDFHLSFGDGVWAGPVGRNFRGSTFVYNSALNFRLKSWRIGVDFAGANAPAQHPVTIRDISFPAGQTFVFGWLGVELQYPKTLTSRMSCAPFIAAGVTFQNPLYSDRRDPEFHLWGAGMHAGGIFDWVFARHTAEKGRYTLGHTLRLRAGVLPRFAGEQDFQGAFLAFWVGYCLKIRPGA